MKKCPFHNVSNDEQNHEEMHQNLQNHFVSPKYVCPMAKTPTIKKTLPELHTSDIDLFLETSFSELEMSEFDAIQFLIPQNFINEVEYNKYAKKMFIKMQTVSNGMTNKTSPIKTILDPNQFESWKNNPQEKNQQFGTILIRGKKYFAMAVGPQISNTNRQAPQNAIILTRTDTIENLRIQKPQLANKIGAKAMLNNLKDVAPNMGDIPIDDVIAEAPHWKIIIETVPPQLFKIMLERLKAQFPVLYKLIQKNPTITTAELLNAQAIDGFISPVKTISNNTNQKIDDTLK